MGPAHDYPTNISNIQHTKLYTVKIYKVGGAVRDQLLGYPHNEIDWVVVGSTPEVMLKAGYSQVGKDFPVFLHPVTKDEYSLARTERKHGHGYHGFSIHADPSVTLQQDLERRDLTINAMAMDDNNTVIDPYGGQSDLAAKLLRHVSPHFIEDPLRVLRTARFAARYSHLGFSIAPETIELMREIVTQNELEHLAMERVWLETERALGELNPEIYFDILQQCGALEYLAPAVPITNGIERLTTAKDSTSNTKVRWASLLCELSPRHAEQACNRLKTPKVYRELASKVCEWRPKVKSALRVPAKCMALLQGLDAFRRDEPFNGFCKTIAALEGNHPEEDHAMNLLAEARNLTLSINASNLTPEGLVGPALGKAITTQRTQSLITLLNEFMYK